ncbi:DNA cytosine methyltransferase [Micromonospora sp. CPCC 206061]|uniref:DNA cytosine methyltransferase n=1 Tax=Micromonospora sp. CPCC 206061 TaxID=3122410 RepID=UPI002FF07E32
MARVAGRYAAVSMFSGSGGMDLGAEQTKRVRVVWANDIEPWAVETYKRNLGRYIVAEDIADLEVPDVPCDILLAGPPCQDYSTLWNHDGLKTARGNLFRHVARFLDALRPAAFVLENVPGLLSANHGAAWTLVRHALRSPSSFVTSPREAPGVRYDLSAQVIDMADLGVPQNRERLIVIGVRRDLRIRPPMIPEPFAGHHRTVADALDRDPIPDDAPNHERGLDSPEVVKRLKLIPPGANYEVIPQGHPSAVKGLISHVYRRLDPNKPAYTMISGGGGGTHGYHHAEPRRLSNREKARLQGFPDDFVFEHGPVRNRASAYARVRRQIGNAVPPPAAKEIVGALTQVLLAAGVPPRKADELAAARRNAGTASHPERLAERRAAGQ